MRRRQRDRELYEVVVTELLEKQGNICSMCGRILLKKLHLHHKIPISLGGLNVLSNLCLLHEKCHRKTFPGSPGAKQYSGTWGIDSNKECSRSKFYET